MSQKIKVSKFGGSSMKDAIAMNRSAQVVQTHQTQMVVVSATYGTTNQLLNLIDLSLASEWEPISQEISQIKERHLNLCKDLKGSKNLTTSIKSLIEELTALCKGIFYLRECTPKAKDRLQSVGEGLSSRLFVQALKNTLPEKDISFLDVRSCITTTKNFTRAAPLIDETRKNCISLEKELLFSPTFYYTHKD